MFAIVKVGNKQFKVKAGDFVRVPFQSLEEKSEVKLPLVAFAQDKDFVIGESSLKGSHAKALVIRHFLDRKVLVFKKKRRKGYRKTKGHRQKLTQIQVVELKSPSGKVEKAKKTVSLKKDTPKKEVKASKDTKAKAKKSHKKVTKQAKTKAKSKTKVSQKGATKKKPTKAKK